ncbi:MAG: hypothetical protein ACLQBY_19155 [Solirubrobacteraceae bacterium]
MRTKFGWLCVFAALAAPLGAMGLGAAPAGAATGTTCSGNSGSIKLSPGLEESAQTQNITIKGTLTDCTGSTVTGGSYLAHLKTTHPVSCAALASAGEAATGTIVIKWSPKGQGNSNGAFSMPLTALAPVSIGGTLESGLFATSSISGTVSQSFAGTCGGGGKGKSKAKKVKNGTFTGSAVEVS